MKLNLYVFNEISFNRDIFSISIVFNYEHILQIKADLNQERIEIKCYRLIFCLKFRLD